MSANDRLQMIAERLSRRRLLSRVGVAAAGGVAWAMGRSMPASAAVRWRCCVISVIPTSVQRPVSTTHSVMPCGPGVVGLRVTGTTALSVSVGDTPLTVPSVGTLWCARSATKWLIEALSSAMCAGVKCSFDHQMGFASAPCVGRAGMHS